MSGDDDDKQSVDIHQDGSGENVTQIGFVQGDVHIHPPPPPSPPGPAALSNLPVRPYGKFVGREQEFDQVLGELQKPQGMLMIALYGMGGIGKTALAHELAGHCISRALFDNVVWISAKEEFFLGAEVQRIAGAGVTLDSVLGDITHQVGQFDVARFPSEQRREALARFLQQHRILIVLDNLESVPRNLEIVAALHGMLGRSRLLITSRHRIAHDQIQERWLAGLDATDGVQFLKTVEEERHITAVSNAHDPLQIRLFLHKKTGGAPLAMRLVIGQLSSQPLDVVVEWLETGARWDAQNYEFYRFVYQQSWNQLNETARMVLVALAPFEPNLGGTAAAVRQVASRCINDGDFPAAINQLVQTSLVQVGGSAENLRYALHPLTWYFVMGDIVKKKGVVRPWE